MSAYTRIYKSSSIFITVVRLHFQNNKWFHYGINDRKRTLFPCAAQWDKFGPFNEGHTYAVLNKFIDCNSKDKNNYVVLSVAEVPQDEASLLSRHLLTEADSRRDARMNAIDDPIFRLRCAELGLTNDVKYDTAERIRELLELGPGIYKKPKLDHELNCLVKYH